MGADLNERLRERVAARNASGALSKTLDEEWEQWLKNAKEAVDGASLSSPTPCPKKFLALKYTI